ncbi:MAG: tetratricopeptide repeat protein [Mesorhizobium sp.]|nr:tetratricopeptide repeat protein [Mesorhizobium sp.]
MLVSGGRALALDPATSVNAPKSNPWDALRDGFDAYKSGHKGEAVEAYRYAAEKGQLGAQWKLARMYADGDGVPRDDYQAFKFYSQVVQQGVDHGSVESAYVADALVALGTYTRTGIPGSPVVANPALAQEYYRDAATNYRNPKAQFELGRMFLSGEGVKTSVKQAGRWLQLAAEKGHAGAQATLGNLLYQRGKVVRGLAMLTAALERAAPDDRVWIGGLQEEAFSLASESDRRTAVALAQDMLAKGE